MNDKATKPVTIRMKSSAVRKARVGAAASDRRIGEWIEEAIEEKAAREKGEET